MKVKAVGDVACALNPTTALSRCAYHQSWYLVVINVFWGQSRLLDSHRWGEMVRAELTGNEVVFIPPHSAQRHVTGSPAAGPIEPKRNVLQCLPLNFLHGRGITNTNREEIDIVRTNALADGAHRQPLPRVGHHSQAAASRVEVKDRAAHPVHEVLPLVQILREKETHIRVHEGRHGIGRTICKHSPIPLVIPWIHFPAERQLCQRRLAAMPEQHVDCEVVQGLRALARAGDHGRGVVRPAENLEHVVGRGLRVRPRPMGAVSDLLEEALAGNGGSCLRIGALY